MTTMFILVVLLASTTVLASTANSGLRGAIRQQHHPYDDSLAGNPFATKSDNEAHDFMDSYIKSSASASAGNVWWKHDLDSNKGMDNIVKASQAEAPVFHDSDDGASSPSE